MFKRLREKAIEKRIWKYREELAFLNANIERLERLVAAAGAITISDSRKYENWVGRRARLQVLLERELTEISNIITAYTEKPVGLKEGIALKTKEEEIKWKHYSLSQV